MKPITREQILDLRKSFEVWQQDYDPIHDKEQYDMFALGVMAMNEMLATMDSEAARRREWMARGALAASTHLADLAKSLSPASADRVKSAGLSCFHLSAKIRAGEVE